MHVVFVDYDGTTALAFVFRVQCTMRTQECEMVFNSVTQENVPTTLCITSNLFRNTHSRNVSHFILMHFEISDLR